MKGGAGEREEGWGRREGGRAGQERGRKGGAGEREEGQGRREGEGKGKAGEKVRGIDPNRCCNFNIVIVR